MVKENYHIHTYFSDGKSSIDDYIRDAIEKGFDEIAFTDHLALKPGSQDVYSYSLDPRGLEDYTRQIRNTAKSHQSVVKTRVGIEVDYIPGLEHALADILGSHEFDLIMGSVHWVDGICIDCPHHRRLLEKKVAQSGFDSFYSRYLSLLKEGVETNLFDIVGHFDVARTWGYAPSDCFADEMRALDRIREAEMAVEISSKGLRRPVGLIHPSKRILEYCRGLGVPVTTGTDAHEVAEMDYMHDALMAYVRDVGYTEVAAFEGRVMKLCPI